MMEDAVMKKRPYWCQFWTLDRGKKEGGDADWGRKEMANQRALLEKNKS